MTYKDAMYCMKANSDYHKEVCEECKLYGQTGTDHCFEDATLKAIEALETAQKIPDVFKELDELSLNSSGKVLYALGVQEAIEIVENKLN